MNRKIRNQFSKIVYSTFVRAQKAGVNILPSHFYSSIPHISSLKKENYWRHPLSFVGVKGKEIEAQAECIKEICTPGILNDMNKKEINADAIRANGSYDGYGVIEGDFLYCFIRKMQPKKIIQIGCGVSTSIILTAAKDSGYAPHIICVEPYPTGFLIELNRQNKITLLAERAQLTDMNVLTDLNENDLFFVDSTHTVKAGSEVNRIILEVLPRLHPHVWIHFHDIYFPYDYRRNILNGDLFFWGESTLLHAFLINNANVQIKVSLSMVHYEKPEILSQYFNRYEPQNNEYGLQGKGGKHFPCSIFLKTVA